MLWASQRHSAARRTTVERFTTEKKRERFRWKERVKEGRHPRETWRGSTADDRDGERERERIGSCDIVGGDDRGTGRDTGGVAIGFLSVAAIAALKREAERPNASEKDGMRQGETHDAVPCEFWHGSRKLLTRGISRKTRWIPDVANCIALWWW